MSKRSAAPGGQFVIDYERVRQAGRECFKILTIDPICGHLALVRTSLIKQCVIIIIIFDILFERGIEVSRDG